MNQGHVRFFTNAGWDHLHKSAKNNTCMLCCFCMEKKKRTAEIDSERYAGELALHSYGTEPDSWHSEDDLWLARRVRDGWGEITLIKVFLSNNRTKLPYGPCWYLAVAWLHFPSFYLYRCTLHRVQTVYMQIKDDTWLLFLFITRSSALMFSDGVGLIFFTF